MEEERGEWEWWGGRWGHKKKKEEEERLERGLEGHQTKTKREDEGKLGKPTVHPEYSTIIAATANGRFPRIGPRLARVARFARHSPQVISARAAFDVDFLVDTTGSCVDEEHWDEGKRKKMEFHHDCRL